MLQEACDANPVPLRLLISMLMPRRFNLYGPSYS